MKKCPLCLGEMKDEEKICPHCGMSVGDQPSAAPSSPEIPQYQTDVNTLNPPVPQAENAGPKYAGFWIRFIAFILDFMIANYFSWLLTTIIIGALVSIFKNVLSIFAFICFYTVFSGYFIILTYKKESTWGKMALGLKLIPSDKEKLSLGQVFLRETIGKIVSFLPFYIGFIMAGLTEKKEAFHDMIAKTNVVYTASTKK